VGVGGAVLSRNCRATKLRLHYALHVHQYMLAQDDQLASHITTHAAKTRVKVFRVMHYLHSEHVYVSINPLIPETRKQEWYLEFKPKQMPNNAIMCGSQSLCRLFSETNDASLVSVCYNADVERKYVRQGNAGMVQ
jgi:hypothetical protein